MGSELLPARQFLNGLAGKTPAGERRLLAAVSGGLDSMCLMHLLLCWGRENGAAITAAHFNHRLRAGTADRDEDFVRRCCADWGAAFVRGEGDTRALAERRGMTVEEAARTLRYAFLERAAAERDCQWILTAHHADDNAETMILNLCRGAGSRGLAGIPQVRGQVARPFLRISRRELEAYAAAHRIPHVEDETNELDDAARNLLRHQVMPVLRQINPRAVENMSRSAAVLRRESEAMDLAAAALADRAGAAARGLRISRDILTGAPEAVASRTVLDLLARVCGHRKDLTALDAEAVLSVARAEGTDRERRLPCGLLVCREGEEVAITCPPPAPEPVPLTAGETAAFGGWQVTLGETAGDGECFALSLPAGEPLTVSRWRRDDRLALPGSRGERSFKRLCADRGIRPWQRDVLPVLRVGETPAAAPWIGADCRFAPAEGKKTVFVSFHQKREENDYDE